MVDEIVTRQELIDAKRDARDLGKAVNEKVIVSPRYGEDFKSLPMISAEFQISSDAAEAAAVSAAESASIATSAAQNANSSANIAEAAATAATIGAGVFDTPEAGVDPVMGVADGAYFNVRSSSGESYVDEYRNVGGVPAPSGKSYPSAAYVQNVAKYTALPFVDGKTYSLNERVQLANGDIVKSTIANNTANPNVDMTGWINLSLLNYVNIVDNWGAKGDGISQDLTFIQAAIDYLHAKFISSGEQQTLLFMEHKTYVCHGLVWKAGVHLSSYGAGKARLLKTPATAGQTDANLKWRRILSSSDNMSTLGNTIRHKLSNIILDGNMDNMNWTYGSYNQEQGMSLILNFSNGSTESDRGKFELNNVEFVNSVSDGICVNANIDVIMNNCSGARDFRGGITITGGNTKVIINNWIGENANIHIEIDGRGFNNTFKTDVTVNGGEVDRLLGKTAVWGGYSAHVKEGAKVIYNNFKCHSGGLTIFAGDTHIDNKITFNNCFLSWAGGTAYNIPKLLEFNNCCFRSDFLGVSSVRDGWFAYWNTAAAPVTVGATIVFNGGGAVGLYDSAAFAGSFIRLNLGGASNDEVLSPFKKVIFTGGFQIEGYNDPYITQYGGISAKFDDVFINTKDFLRAGANNSITSGEANFSIELGKVWLGSKNERFYSFNGNANISRIRFYDTIVPLDKFVISESGAAAYWDVFGQMTVTARLSSDINSSHKFFSGSRIVFINASKDEISEYTAYPDGMSGTKSKLTKNLYASKVVTNSVTVVKQTYDPPSLANGLQQSTTVSLAGANVGDNINVSFDKPLSGTRMWGEVTSANTVTVYHRNDTGAVVDVPSGTLKVKLI